EGVALAHKYDHEFPKTYFGDFVEYLGITEERFWEVIDRYRAPHTWEKENAKWKRKKVVSNDDLSGEKPEIE
ncbi:MAG: hypothetical protein WBC16_07650, partial [Candidatus Omnitrophota bacterium]